MPFNTYSALQTAIANWLNRTDMAANVPDWITLAEAEITRRLRRTTVAATLTTIPAAEFLALPSDCKELRSVRLSTGLPEQDTPLVVSTVEQLAERRATWNNILTRPQWCAVYNGNLQFVPIPDQAYTVVITYYQMLIALATAPGAVNVTLAEFPDLYLYGALMQASPFLEDDARLPTWEAKFEKAFNQLQITVDREEMGASFKQGRLPNVF